MFRCPGHFSGLFQRIDCWVPKQTQREHLFSNLRLHQMKLADPEISPEALGYDEFLQRFRLPRAQGASACGQEKPICLISTGMIVGQQ